MQEPSTIITNASLMKQSDKLVLDLDLPGNSPSQESYVKNLAENPAAIYLASLKPTGRRSMLTVLNVMAGLLSNGQQNAFTFAWHELRYQHTAALRTALQERYKPATANKAISAFRRVLKEAWRLGLIGAEEYGRAADIKAIKGQRLPRGRALKGGELTALLSVCSKDDSPLGFRDAALIAVLYASGLRRSEVVKLNLKDYDEETGALTILGGKGGKDRIAYLGTGSEIVDDWLQLRGRTTGPLFLPIRRGGHIKPQRLNEQSVLDILKKRGNEAGLKAFSPHDMRRTFISDLLDAGADIATVQKLAGHADVQTTAKYDRRGEVTKRAAAGKLHLPYTRTTKNRPPTQDKP